MQTNSTNASLALHRSRQMSSRIIVTAPIVMMGARSRLLDVATLFRCDRAGYNDRMSKCLTEKEAE
jgi:hypothetical protein